MNPYKSKPVRAATAIALLFAVAACGGQSESEEKATEGAKASQETSAADAATDAVETAEEALSAAEEEAADAIENTQNNPDEMMKAASETAETASAKLANFTSNAAAAGDSMVQAAVMETTDTAELIQAAVTDAVDEASAALNGDATAGKRAFVKCMACHTVQEGQHRVGPSLHGIVGKTAGTVEGFRTYSPANKNSGVTWTPEVMFDYLENPQRFMPGTRMVFPGIPSEKERADLIAYLQSVSE